MYYRKETGKPRVSYNDAVEEALCFGWIDSQQKGIDEERFAQRFSPRKNTRVWSESNKERLRKLIRAGLMTPAGMAVVGDALEQDDLVVPPKILAAIKADPKAWRNFQDLPVAYKRIRIAYIESRRRHGEDMYQKALANFVKATAAGRRIGIAKELREP